MFGFFQEESPNLRRNHSLVKAQDSSKNKDLVKMQSQTHTYTHTKHLLHLMKKREIERNSELKTNSHPPRVYPSKGSPPEKRVLLGSEASLRLQSPSRRELDWASECFCGFVTSH